MRCYSFVLVLACGIVCSALNSAGAQTILIDETTTISSSLTGAVRCGTVNTDIFLVQLVTGGSVSGSVHMFNKSLFSMAGGSVGASVNANDTTQVSVSGGNVGNFVSARGTGGYAEISGAASVGNAAAFDSGHLQLRGGTVRGQLQAFGMGIVDWYGGSVGGVAFVHDDATLNYYGGTFTGSFTLQPSGNSTSNFFAPPRSTIFATNFSAPANPLLRFHGTNLVFTPLDNGNGRVTGTAANGGTFDTTIVKTGNASYRVELVAVPRTLEGTVTFPGNRAQTLSFEFRPENGNAFTRNVTLDSNGGFSFDDIPAGKYDVAIDGSKWLRRVVTGVNLTAGPVTDFAASLIPGDIDGDNMVTFDDFVALANSYELPTSDPAYKPNADLDSDGDVDFDDFVVLANHYELIGDE